MNPLSRLLRACAPLLILLFLGAAGAVRAQGVPLPTPPGVAAKGYLLEDFHSGRTLAERNADERLEPASITKLMTAYAVFQALREGTIGLQDQVTVSEKAWRTGGSRMFIEVGKQVSVEALLQGMIIQSGNDASVALAEYVAGSEESFAGLMNRYAAELGMGATHFTNATGLPDENHYTTARDIARLARALIVEFPEYYKWYAQKEYTYNDITQLNRNRLLWRDPSVDGLKTGHTDSAGYCLVTSAERQGMRLITVILGAESENARANETQKLINYGFRFYETHRLYGAGERLSRARVWKGEQEEVALAPARDIHVTIPRNRYKEMEASMQINGQIIAPVEKGRRYGVVQISFGGEEIAEVPLVAVENVAAAGLFGSLIDSVLLMFE